MIRGGPDDEYDEKVSMEVYDKTMEFLDEIGPMLEKLRKYDMPEDKELFQALEHLRLWMW